SLSLTLSRSLLIGYGWKLSSVCSNILLHPSFFYCCCDQTYSNPLLSPLLLRLSLYPTHTHTYITCKSTSLILILCIHQFGQIQLSDWLYSCSLHCQFDFVFVLVFFLATTD